MNDFSEKKKDDRSLISVIVPIFNTRQYLDACVKSLVEQSYPDIEIILVDDSSTDGCAEKCDLWAASDPRVRVIHQENRGLSSARNAGVAASTGAYLSFVDSDDWVDRDFYRTLLTEIKENQAGIAASGVKKLYQNTEQEYLAENRRIYTPEEALETVIQGTTFTVMACNKLFKRELIGPDCFPAGHVHEDDYVMYKIIDSSAKLVFCKDVFYHYRQRKQGIIGSGLAKRFDDKYASFCQNRAFIEEKYPQLMWRMKLLLCRYTVDDYVELQRTGENHSVPEQRILQYRKSVKFTPRELGKLNRSQWKMVLLSSVNFKGYCRHRLRSQKTGVNQYEYFE